MSNIDIDQLKAITVHLKRLEATVQMAQTVIQDIGERLNGIADDISTNAYKIDLMLGAHCIKCGDPILGKEDSLCQRCV